MNRKGFLIWISAFLMVAGLMAVSAGAEEKADMGGWGPDSEYNQHYKTSERDRIKGIIADIIEVKPLPGMSPGVALVVKDSEGETVTVHLAPKWYEKAHPSRLRKGDPVKIKGVWAEIGGREIFMAAKVKWNESEEYKVRKTKDGKPFWTLEKEEHAREMAEAGEN
jgi:hypothetical protein